MSEQGKNSTGKPLFKRRGVLLGAAALAGAWWLRPNDEGGPYTPYFEQLNQALKEGGIARPRMLLDLDQMDANIDAISNSVAAPKTWRVVVKSLPSIDLLEYIMARANTNALMGFHQPFLTEVAARIPTADVLMGKPLPVAAVARFYDTLPQSEFRPERQLQWLIDSEERLLQYQELAQAKGLKLQIALELDIGLHRGGFDTPESLAGVLDEVAADPEHLELSGFMGYEAFLAKLPGQAGRLEKAKALYRELVAAVRQRQPQLFERELTYNIAGSQTYTLYEDEEFFNDLSAGSGVVMPTDFDMPTLAQHRPACYIATPVLKQYDRVLIPGVEAAAPLFAAVNPNRQQAFYTYGGNWLADHENPPGLVNNSLWGYSSNQEMVNASNRVDLAVGDFIFMRPRQSEAVFLQFGDLLTVRGGALESAWPVFKET